MFPGALIAAGHAQTGLLTGALLVGAAALVDKRPVASGLLIGALIIKPHLAILLPFWLAAGGRWRAFIAAGASVAGLLGLSWLVFGSETAGLPEALREGFAPAQRVRLPMRSGQRSLNLSNAVAVVVFEAWRQQGFAGPSS